MPEKKGEKNIRLDRALFLRRLVSSRARGEALIKEGGVSVNGVVVKNKSALVRDADVVALLMKESAWVSRGALKLLHALELWKINPKGKTVIDIGASTGGFTEVLLSRGAKKVYAVDVGHGQLAEKLLADPRVVNMEGIHIEKLSPSDVEGIAGMVVIDASFISLEKVLPKAKELLKKKGVLVALIKPQFEVGKARIKKGIVNDPKLHAEVCRKIEGVAQELGFAVLGVILSPVLGGDGNKEFLLFARREA
ncbi:MAG: hypothetical protein A3D65_02690 [Candidatus Lloydbacteria bacterium RIFCSPHIGHO2_02_FULL_50_13]|uniref:RNA-binding S4 domain-containing protein n=1 Tax=Candidatus Lloydbacteria bacterium RIFCSPHIGHO2_02_FULL_50_13 TaxID=1798661 RepID=A0A1G2D3Z2_9BACT|nr:MAG: hypothetical protein A3D65_02690 [Candidatus Lloydbacteria bacterium RIFCSPHIGHO2_02_FULL_50_13]